MKKIYLVLAAVMGAIISAWGQNPGLIISEFYQNPGGTDSPYEYVELLATDNIDFSVTPYTIIACNNGTATASGWILGGVTTYAFEISSGTVSVGDVVYVGGTLMAPAGTILRAINTGVTGGDGGIGSPNASGIIGNGGTSADGIAVFNLPVGSITSSTIPTDAVFYGTGVGTAFVTPTTGYELPTNDFYSGGKMQLDSYYAVDEDLTVATGGVFDLVTNTFIAPRTFAAAAATDGVSEITFGAVAVPKFSFTTEDLTVVESDGVISLTMDFSDANGELSSVDVTINGVSNAISPDDFILVDTTITFVGDVDGTATFTFNIVDDLLEEQSEYIIITMDNLVNAEAGELTEVFLYISDNDRLAPVPTNELKFELLTSLSTGVEGESSAEIVVFDPITDQLFIVNSVANQIDIVDFSIPELPVLIDSIEFDSVGFINSVAIYNSVIAVAVAAPVIQDSGFVSFWNTDATFLNRLTVGALPDMVTFNHDGTQLVVACEGEPNADYTVDPNGGVGIIEIDGPIEDLTADDVVVLNFTAFDADEAALKAAGVRIYGPGASVAMDFEPEYVTIMDDNSKAYVVLQENNAMAVVDLITKEIIEIRPLGTIDHSALGFGLDASNSTSGINIANFPIKGMFLPDALDHISILGSTYLVTANEGDTRDYDGFGEEERVRDLVLDSLTFPNREYLQNSLLLGRLKTTSTLGDTDEDGDYDEIYTFGTRSFSIWDEATGDLVFDSGDLIESIVASHPIYSEIFNASNEDSPAPKDRSDDKGPEPEGISVEYIDGNAYLFVSMERVGGVMAFNINVPSNPVFIGYHNNRDFATNGPDRGAEGMIYIDAAISPNGKGLLVLANEISSSLSIYEVNSCQSISDLVIATTDDEAGFCIGDSLEISAITLADLSFEWQMDGEILIDETEASIFANEPGFYQVSFVNDAEGCIGTTDSLFIVENELPIVEAFVSADSICFDQEVTFTSTGAETYLWDVAGVTNDVPYTPVSSGEIVYTVLGTDVNGCENSDFVSVTMAEELVLTIVTTDEIFGTDGSIDLTIAGGFGAYLIDWDNDGLGDFDDEEDLSDLTGGTYIVSVEDGFGCAVSETVIVNSQAGLSELNSSTMAVYPNPANDFIFIETTGNFTYQLSSVNGQILISGVAFEKERVDLSGLAAGIYLIQMNNENNQTQTVKVTIY